MQLLGCHYEKELDDMADSIKRPVSQSRPDPSTTVVEENFIVEEIKRRTFWSCYIVDRYISSGDYKPRRIHVKDALVQMPCSQDAFLHGIYRIKTRMLRETDEHFDHRRKEYAKAHAKEDDVEWEDEDKQEPLVWYIKALDLYEDVMKWACTVTRRYVRRVSVTACPVLTSVEMRKIHHGSRHSSTSVTSLVAALKRRKGSALQTLMNA